MSPVQSPEAAASGAALLAGVGAGIWPDVATAARETVVVGEPTLPDGTRPEAAYQRFRALYGMLEPSFPTP